MFFELSLYIILDWGHGLGTFSESWETKGWENEWKKKGIIENGGMKLR